MPYLVRQANENPDLLENVFTFKQVENYIAFNRDTPDDVVTAWQRALDDIRAEGLYKRLYNNLVHFKKQSDQ